MGVAAQLSGGALPAVAGIGAAAYAAITLALLWAYARTRLYPLYVLKSLWVGLTIAGFAWIVMMSCADPGPAHGGQSPEFMRHPAGPFGALANYGAAAERLYASSPGWIFALAGLLVLWRGLVGHPHAAHDGARQRAWRRGYLAASVATAAALLLFLDRHRAIPLHRYTGALLLLAACASWRFLPAARAQRLGRWAFLALAMLAVAPAVLALAAFDWRPYTYGAQNYAYAWNTARMGPCAVNSLLVSLLAVGITLLAASMAAYALSRFEFVGRHAVLFTFVGAMVLPVQLFVVPLFLMIRPWHLELGGWVFNFMDSRLGLSIIYAATGLPFTIFLLAGFYRTLPGSLREAAAIDGCGEWRLFKDVYFPLAAPGMATAAIFQFLGVWNEYQLALIFLTNDKLMTLPISLYNLSVSQQYAAHWSALFAGVTILCLPTFVIFVLLQERIVAGLTVGAVRE